MWWSRVSIRDQRSATGKLPVLGNTRVSSKFEPELSTSSIRAHLEYRNERVPNKMEFVPFRARTRFFQGSVDKFYVGEAKRNTELWLFERRPSAYKTVLYPFTTILQFSKYLSEQDSCFLSCHSSRSLCFSLPLSLSCASLVSILVYPQRFENICEKLEFSYECFKCVFTDTEYRWRKITVSDAINFLSNWLNRFEKWSMACVTKYTLDWSDNNVVFLFIFVKLWV